MMLTASLVRVREGSAEAAIAKIIPKKNKIAIAIAPNIVTIFTINCVVTPYNLILPFEKSSSMLNVACTINGTSSYPNLSCKESRTG